VLPRILAELKRNGRKTSHWAWWVFPTTLEGMSEPPPSTKVTPDTAYLLLQDKETTPLWRDVLELLCELIEKSQGITPGGKKESKKNNKKQKRPPRVSSKVIAGAKSEDTRSTLHTNNSPTFYPCTAHLLASLH
jgi:hypothetical protein